jgi:hypothetical protein
VSQSRRRRHGSRRPERAPERWPRRGRERSSARCRASLRWGSGSAPPRVGECPCGGCAPGPAAGGSRPPWGSWRGVCREGVGGGRPVRLGAIRARPGGSVEGSAKAPSGGRGAASRPCGMPGRSLACHLARVLGEPRRGGDAGSPAASDEQAFPSRARLSVASSANPASVDRLLRPHRLRRSSRGLAAASRASSAVPSGPRRPQATCLADPGPDGSRAFRRPPPGREGTARRHVSRGSRRVSAAFGARCAVRGRHARCSSVCFWL